MIYRACVRLTLAYHQKFQLAHSRMETLLRDQMSESIS